MPTHEELANREWVGELRDKMGEMVQSVPDQASFDPMPLDVITSFSSHFAEWEIKGDDVLVHVFPRSGGEDQWVVGHYIPRCRNCKSDVPVPEKLSQMTPCERCGHSGLVYIPSSAESFSESEFPENMEDLIMSAADKMWAGQVAIDRASVLRYGEDADIAKDEPVEADMKAYVVQFQRARNTAKVMEPGKFIDAFCEALDAQLDQ